MEKKKLFHKKKGGEAHVCKEWDFEESSSDSPEEDIAIVVINKGILFPIIDHKCIMAKEGKKEGTSMKRVNLVMTRRTCGCISKALASVKLRKILSWSNPLTRRMNSWKTKRIYSSRNMRNISN
jgi:hypothetical protein